jgi:hypothetical protein
MKIVFLILVSLTITANVFSQDYMEDIALKSCECFSTVSDTFSTERFSMEVGLCMIEAATPYKKQLKKDYKIDFNKIDTQGEELGRIIGVKMVSICPDAIMEMASRMNDDKEMQSTSLIYDGYVTKIEDNQFVVFSVKDNDGKTTKFYWLTFIDIDYNIELTSQYKMLVHESVKITFVQQEFFDYRIGEYRTFNIIQKIQRLSE